MADLKNRILNAIANTSAGEPFASPAAQQDKWAQELSTVLDTITPIGTIMAWHKSLGGASGTPSLPEGWVQCDGQTLSDSESVYDGEVIPNLNGGARFLRGSATSGTEQAPSAVTALGGTGSGETFVEDNDGTRSTAFSQGRSVTGAGTPITAYKTRPINMSVVWIIRIK